MTYQPNVELNIAYTFDFSKEGITGETGTFDMIPELNPLEKGLVIKKVSALVTEELIPVDETTVVEVGNDADPNGYFEDIITAYPLHSCFETGFFAGDLLWDNANDQNLNYYISTDADVVPKITVSTAAMTSGKIKLVFTCMKF